MPASAKIPIADLRNSNSQISASAISHIAFKRIKENPLIGGSH